MRTSRQLLNFGIVVLALSCMHCDPFDYAGAEATLKDTIQQIAQDGLPETIQYLGTINQADFSLDYEVTRTDETWGTWQLWVTFENGAEYMFDLGPKDKRWRVMTLRREDGPTTEKNAAAG